MQMYHQTEYYSLLEYGVLLIGNLFATFKKSSLFLYLWSSKQEEFNHPSSAALKTEALRSSEI
jgi:hypothetical protein